MEVDRLDMQDVVAVESWEVDILSSFLAFNGAS